MNPPEPLDLNSPRAAEIALAWADLFARVEERLAAEALTPASPLSEGLRTRDGAGATNPSAAPAQQT